MIVALHESEVGAAFIDWFTPMHFGLGFTAGALGLNPHLAAILFVGMRTAKLAAEEGLGHALFSTEHGQSHANELTDLTAEFLGLYAGGKARSLITGRAPVEGLHGKIAGMAAPPPINLGRLPIAGL
jgi:hypothetical protein